jgi:phosphohistidine phosphatase
MAKWLKPRLAGDWRILASPSKRTLQTVEPLNHDYATESAVAPGASAKDVLKAAGWPGNSRDVVVVGHQPTLGEVASMLLLEEDGGTAIRKGAIWWFEARATAGKMNVVLKAVLSPDLLDD